MWKQKGQNQFKRNCGENGGFEKCIDSYMSCGRQRKNGNAK